MKLLDLEALKPKAPEQEEQKDLLVSGRHAIRSYVIDPERFDSVKGAIGDLQQDTHHSVFSFGGVHARHVLAYVVDQIGPCNLIFTTWAISLRSVQDLLKMIEHGDIDLIGCVLSDRVGTECPSAFQMIKANTDKFWLKKIHAKSFVAWNDQWHVSVKMTANFTENQRAETFDIMTSKQVYDVHRLWINKLTDGKL